MAQTSARATSALDSRIVPARNASFLLQRAVQAGMSPQTVLAGTGLEDENLHRPGDRITQGQLIRIHENLVDSGADWLGLAGEVEFNIGNYGLLGYAMLSCATLGQAIEIAVRYYRTAGPLFELGFVDDGRTFAIEFDNVFRLRTPVLTVVVEDLFGSFPDLLRLLLGRPVGAERVTFSYPAPPHEPRYHEVFRCPIEFDAPRSSFVIDRALLDAELAQADADSAVLLERSCRELLDEIESETTLSSAIRKRLLDASRKDVSADEMAEWLAIGTRTLRRRLETEGTSYQAILDDVRARLAIDYLTTTHLSTQQIGELLGFSEATNFRRAFIRWTDKTPKSYRDAHR